MLLSYFLSRTHFENHGSIWHIYRTFNVGRRGGGRVEDGKGEGQREVEAIGQKVTARAQAFKGSEI